MSTRKTTIKTDGKIITHVSSPVYDIVYAKPAVGKRKSATQLSIWTREGDLVISGRAVTALRKILSAK